MAQRRYRVAISHYKLATANLTAPAKSQAPKPSPAGTLKVTAQAAFAELVVASSFRLGLAGITLEHQVGDAPKCRSRVSSREAKRVALWPGNADPIT